MHFDTQANQSVVGVNWVPIQCQRTENDSSWKWTAKWIIREAVAFTSKQINLAYIYWTLTVPMFKPLCLQKILRYCEILYMYSVKYFVKYKIHKCIFVFCISNTFVKKYFTKYLKYILQLYFVFKYFWNVFYPALGVVYIHTMRYTNRCLYLLYINNDRQKWTLNVDFITSLTWLITRIHQVYFHSAEPEMPHLVVCIRSFACFSPATCSPHLNDLCG